LGESRSSQDVREGAGAGAGARGLKQEPSLAKKKAYMRPNPRGIHFSNYFSTIQTIESVLAFLPPKTCNTSGKTRSLIWADNACDVSKQVIQNKVVTACEKRPSLPGETPRIRPYEQTVPRRPLKKKIGCSTELDFEYMGWRRDWQQQQCDCCYMLEIIL
jgi:hypothetical protein